MSKEFSQEELNAIKVLNGSHSNNGNKTIPNEHDLSWYYSELDKLNFNLIKKSDILNFSKKGFETYLMLVYRQMGNFVSSNWEYNDSFLNDLGIVSDGIDKYLLDQKLIENGSMAIVKINEKYYIVSFTAIEVDIYDHPTKIKTLYTKNSESTWNGRVFTKDNFIIIKNEVSQFNILLKTLPSLELEYKALCQIYNLIFSTMTHFLQLKSGSFNLDTSNIGAYSLSDLVNSSQPFITYSVNAEGEVSIVDSRAKKMGNASSEIIEAWKDSIIEIKQEVSLLPEMWNTYLRAREETKTFYGVSTNTNIQKAERQITSEIEGQQDLPEAQKMAMFNSRKFALNKANQKWNTNWDISLIEKDIRKEDDENERQWNEEIEIDL